MTDHTLRQPLARRLVGRYLMFGLAGLLASIALAVAFSLRGTFRESVALTAAIPMLVLACGAWVLHGTVRVNEAVERQLRRFGAATVPEAALLEPLAEADPIAAGWNKLIRRLHDSSAIANLESRLKSLAGSAGDGRWNSVFNTLTDGIAVCNHHGVVQECNASCAALLGADHPLDLSGKPIGELLRPLVDAAHADKLGAVLETHGVCVAELRRGQTLAAGVLRLSRTPIVGDNRQVGSSLWTIRDITQQKLAEEMRNQFVQTATHELRTPLANIKAYAETLIEIEDIDLDKQKGFYNIINAEATRLSRFVDQLLNISEMEAGAVTIARRETDLERLLSEIIASCQPLASAKNLLFESLLPPKLPKLTLDKDKFTAALVNLLSNAVKYTPEHGSVRFLVEVDDNQIHFHVDDTGIGIANDELPRLCEKFFRSQDSRVQSITGSGLGLAFAQEVAHLHGGNITIASEVNKGSRFTFSLPLK